MANFIANSSNKKSRSTAPSSHLGTWIGTALIVLVAVFLIGNHGGDSLSEADLVVSQPASDDTESTVEAGLIREMCQNHEFGAALRFAMEGTDNSSSRRPSISPGMEKVLKAWNESELQPEPEDIALLEILALERNVHARGLMIRATQGRSSLPDQTRLAAREGHLPSVMFMGKTEEKQGNLDEAVRWYFQGAVLGSVDAMYRFGECRLLGKGIDANPQEAVKFLDQAAAEGDARAMDLLGVCYDRGMGVPADQQLATEWFHSAVAAGSVPAYYNLATRYAKGLGVPKNPTVSTELFRTGASLGNAKCMAAFARCLEVGFGVESDFEQATQWYVQSAAKGNEEGITWCRVRGISIQAGLD